MGIGILLTGQDKPPFAGKLDPPQGGNTALPADDRL
jgi:hypothetical protein